MSKTTERGVYAIQAVWTDSGMIRFWIGRRGTEDGHWVIYSPELARDFSDQLAKMLDNRPDLSASADGLTGVE